MDDYTTMRPVIPVADPVATERRGADLRLGRVLLGLAVAPLLGAALMTLGIYLASFFDGSVRWKDLALAMLAPIVWSVFCGLAYLQTIARLRERIAQQDCLLLGSASSLLLPFIIDLAGTLLLRGHFATVDWAHLKIYACAGLFSVPFGLFGGWVFWRLGVRPAEAAARDFAPVFD
jgi:uncharacterized membrane protein